MDPQRSGSKSDDRRASSLPVHSQGSIGLSLLPDVIDIRHWGRVWEGLCGEHVPGNFGVRGNEVDTKRAGKGTVHETPEALGDYD